MRALSASRVVLHVGEPKAGSTSLQRECALNAARLATQDVLWWDAPEFGLEPHYLLVRALRHLADLPQKSSIVRISRLGGEAAVLSRLGADLAGATGTVLLSGEGILSLPRHALMATTRFVRECCPGAEISAVVVLRPPWAALASRVQQQMKNAHDRPSAMDEVRLRAPLRQRLERLDVAFGPGQVTHLELPRRGDGLAGMFFELVLGVDDADFDRVPRQNGSMSERAAQIHSELASATGGAPASSSFRFVARLVREHVKGAPFLASPEEVLDYVEHSRQDVAWVRERTGIDLMVGFESTSLPRPQPPDPALVGVGVDLGLIVSLLKQTEGTSRPGRAVPPTRSSPVPEADADPLAELARIGLAGRVPALTRVLRTPGSVRDELAPVVTRSLQRLAHRTSYLPNR